MRVSGCGHVAVGTPQQIRLQISSIVHISIKCELMPWNSVVHETGVS